MKVLCPECKHWWDTDIFPNNTPGDIMQKTAVAAEFAEVPASTRTLDCPKCKKTIINTFFLCRTCFKGWKYYNISKIGERDGKQVWMPITIPCSECGAQLTKREYKTPQEIAIFDKLLAQRPEIASGLQYLRELEKQQEKKNRTP